MRPLTLAAALMCWAFPIRAFQIESGASVGCHEGLTAAAVHQWLCPEVGCKELHSPVLPSESLEPVDALTAKVAAQNQFVMALPARTVHQQLAVYSLIQGVRFNDLRGFGADNLLELRNIHSAPDGQAEHCLRAASDDGPNGDVQALSACRAFIDQQLEAAAQAIELRDETAFEWAPVHLSQYGTVRLKLLKGFFHLGRALHTVQDAYAHTLRTADLRHIVAVGNYLECSAKETYAEAADGPCHSSEMDACVRAPLADGTGLEEQQALNDEARRVSLRLLTAFTRWVETGDRTETTACLNESLQLLPGCDLSNHYCETPWLNHWETERPLSRDVYLCGCQSGQSTLILPIVLLGLILKRQKRD